MPRMHAVSADAGFLAWTSDPAFGARVHSVFTRVVNLECSRTGTLYTVACAGTDNAPTTLVVDAPSFDGLAPVVGAPVTCTGRTLRSGPAFAVSLDGARRWSPALPEWPADGMPARWLRDVVAHRGPTGGLGIVGGTDDARDGLACALGRVTAALERALARGDAAEARVLGARLVGLGPGLTPSGDDYLVGLATVCNVPGSPVAQLRPLVAGLVADGTQRTNAISHAAMAHAAEGRVRESIGELLAAMARRDRPATEERARQVLSIGASSGADILTGVLAGLELAQVGRG
jgi:hypothetical protein